MPELPEVETIVRQLAPVLPGSRITRVLVHRPDLLGGAFPHLFRTSLRGREIHQVLRRGKNIVVRLSPPGFLVVNLGMTGRLLLRPSFSRGPSVSHKGITFHLDLPGTLFYTDIRRFGLLRFRTAEEWGEESMRLGPEPLDPGFSPRAFHTLLRASRSPVRSWLLDQRHLAGVGNIYALESLFRAGVHPARPARTLDRAEAGALLRGLREVLRNAIEARGTTLRDYRTASGEEGGFGQALLVYGREGEPCSRCKTPVRRSVFGNRSAFFCPRCQPEAH